MKLLRQIALLFALCVAGELLSALTGGALPGNVLGMALLLILLLSECLKPKAVENAADFFLGNMAVFFLPATLGILRVYRQLENDLIKLVLICAVTTFLTAASAGWTVMLVRRLQQRGGRK